MNPVKTYQEWRENYRVFRFYFRKYRKFYLYGILSLVVVDGLEVLPPLLLKAAVDGVTEKPYGPELQLLLVKVVVAYMAIALVQAWMRYLWRKFIVRTSMYASHDMRHDLFVHLSSMSPGFFQKKRVGDLVSLATNDIEAVRFSLGPGALLIFDSLFYFLAIPPIMFWISPELTLLAFLPLFIVPFFVRRMEGLIQQRFREVQDRFSDLASRCQEALGGVRIVKGSALEPFKEREFAALGIGYQEASLRSARTQATLTTGLETTLSLSTTLLFLVGGMFVIGEKISLGVFVAFQRYIGKMAWPMESLGLAANIFQRSLASQKRVDEVMLREAGVLDPKTNRKLEKNVPSIVVKNLSFTYPGAPRPALENISFELPAGKRVGIAGGVGSGKSTLLSCLARLQPIPAGTISFNGMDATEIPFTEIRRRLAFVPQESFLFSRSIADNILYGSEDFLETDLHKREQVAVSAASLAAVDDDIQRLPKKYASVLGERGSNLSGGQRQRLTIARAIARAPQVMLLDDCLSAVDSETEKKLLHGLWKASEGISLLVASHRTSSLLQMDWVILLEQGKIVAQGKPEVLRNHQTMVELTRQERLKNMDLLQ